MPVGRPDFRRQVDNPDDLALRSQAIDYERTDIQVLSGNTEVVHNVGNATGSMNWLMNASGVIRSGNAGAGTDKNVSLLIQVFNSTPDVINEFLITAGQGGAFFPQGFPVEDGGTVKIEARNDSGSDIDIEVAFGWRTD